MDIFDRLKADLITVGGALRALRYTTHIAKNPTRVFPQLIEELAEKYGDAPALLSDRESLSYRELGARSNRYARWALAQGIAKGDTVCLLMPNRPEFLAIWIGITRVGGVVALLNTNLIGKALAHCINVVTPRHIIVDAEMLAGAAIGAAAPHGQRQHQDLAARRRRRRPAAHRPRDRRLLRRRARRRRAPRADDRGPRAVHLHLGHDRPAQGRQHQPLPADAGDPRLRRRHEHARLGPHVRLPAALPHLRRRACDRRAAAQGRLGGDPRALLRARVLGRRGALGVHAAAIYRRVLPLSREFAAAPEGARAQAAARLRQRPAARRLGRVQAALPDPARSSSSTPPPKAT